MPEDQILLDTKDAGKLLANMSPGAVRVRCCRGELPYRKWNGKIVFLRSELEAWAKGLPGINLKQALKNTGK